MYCYVVGRNLVNGQPKEFMVAEGAVFTENYNETLDTGTIILDQLTEKIEIEPFDVVVVSNYGEPTQIAYRRMCVDTFTCTQVSLNPPLYKYEITLFSETKLLEGILLPNLAITKRLNAAARSVYYYLEKYLDQYCPDRYSDEWTGAYGNIWSFGANIKDPTDTVQSRFGAIDCPELQWNEPTLREVLTDLMMVDDCIPVMKNNVINFIDISQTDDEVSADQLKGINYIRESHSSADYVSELKMGLVNAANNSIPTGSYESTDDENVPADSTRIVERIGFRNNESYILNTNNMELQTSFPIWKLFSCDLTIRAEVDVTIHSIIDGTPDQHIIETHEITVHLKNSQVDYIPEHSEWLTKDVFYGDWGTSATLSNQYRNTCLYYIRGSRNIFNFNAKYEQQFLWISNTQYVLDLIFKSSDFRQALNEVGLQMFEDAHLSIEWQYAGATVADPSWKDCMFEVAYEPIDECVFRASKSPLQRHIRQVVDNQSTSYIDVKRQGLLEYMKANRLGNKIVLINARYSEHESNIPALAQTLGGKIIFQKQISVYRQHLDVNYLATENYVLRDYFTGVKSKLRIWPVISGNEAFVRAESMKFYINSSIPSISNTSRVIPSYSDLQTYLERFKYCAVIFNTSQGDRPVSRNYKTRSFSTNAIMVEFSKHIVGNSVVFTLKMVDNAYNGNYISNYYGSDGRVEQKGIQYTDDNGEITGGEVRFYDEIDSNWYDADEGWPDSFEGTRALRPLVHVGNTEGHLIDAHMVAKLPFFLYKDNKEILQISIQFEMNEDANDMFLGHKD